MYELTKEVEHVANAEAEVLRLEERKAKLQRRVEAFKYLVQVLEENPIESQE